VTAAVVGVTALPVSVARELKVSSRNCVGTCKRYQPKTHTKETNAYTRSHKHPPPLKFYKRHVCPTTWNTGLMPAVSHRYTQQSLSPVEPSHETTSQLATSDTHLADKQVVGCPAHALYILCRQARAQGEPVQQHHGCAVQVRGPRLQSAPLHSDPHKKRPRLHVPQCDLQHAGTTAAGDRRLLGTTAERRDKDERADLKTQESSVSWLLLLLLSVLLLSLPLLSLPLLLDWHYC
jgi:hypothetical protein